MKHQFHYVAALIGAGMLLTLDPLRAADGEDRWRFTATLPIWAAGIEGDATVRDVTADIDIGFEDLTEHLDASFSLNLEARKERFGFYAGAGYMKFSTDESSARGFDAEAEMRLLIADVGGFYRLAKLGEERPLIIEGLGGLRYWWTETDLELKGPRGRVLFDSGDNIRLWDPVIGLRAAKFLTPKLHLDFQGDVGGFGISDDSSDLTWSAAGLVGYEVTRWFGLSAGYRALALNAEGERGSELDIVMHGLLLTARFKF